MAYVELQSRDVTDWARLQLRAEMRTYRFLAIKISREVVRGIWPNECNGKPDCIGALISFEWDTGRVYKVCEINEGFSQELGFYYEIKSRLYEGEYDREVYNFNNIDDGREWTMKLKSGQL